MSSTHFRRCNSHIPIDLQMADTKEVTESPSIETSSKVSSGIFSDIINSVFEPGVNTGLIVGMHLSFLGLFSVLVCLWVLTSWNGHVLVLSGVSLALWGSTAWFVNELLIVQAQQKASLPLDEKDTTTASASAVDVKGPSTSSADPSEPQPEIKKKR